MSFIARSNVVTTRNHYIADLEQADSIFVRKALIMRQGFQGTWYQGGSHHLMGEVLCR
eukprot:gene4097-2918_t